MAVDFLRLRLSFFMLQLGDLLLFFHRLQILVLTTKLNEGELYISLCEETKWVVWVPLIIFGCVFGFLFLLIFLFLGLLFHIRVGTLWNNLFFLLFLHLNAGLRRLYLHRLLRLRCFWQKVRCRFLFDFNCFHLHQSLLVLFQRINHLLFRLESLKFFLFRGFLYVPFWRLNLVASSVRTRRTRRL